MTTRRHLGWLVAFGAALSAAAGCGPRPGPGEAAGHDPPPCIVLYLIDTLRIDRLGCFGSQRGLSPAIDAFAREALAFRAVAQSSWTRPSVTSIFVGQWPWRHGVNGRDDALGESAVTLAELLSGAGYRTVAFTTNDQVSPAFGLDQGFDDFRQLNGTETYLLDSSQRVGDAAARWLAEERDGRPFFLFLHTIDPHAPYRPPERFRQRFAAEVEEPALSPAARAELERLRHRRARRKLSMTGWDLRFGSVPWMMALASGSLPPSPEIASGLARLYDAEVAANDEQLGRLIEQLRRIGVYDDCLIVLVSDHGEEFHEHGNWLHGTGLHAEVLDVPLLVKPPRGRAAPAAAAPGRAQHVDVLPTILDLAGVEAPAGVEGTSLLRLRAGELDRRPAFSYLGLEGVAAASVVLGRWKLVRSGGAQAEVALYDLAADPGETTNVAAARPDEVDLLERLLRERLSQAAGSSRDAVVDQAVRDRLEALGYL